MDLALKGKVAWVVGATGTLGKQIAEDLAREGAEVYISGRDGGKLGGVGDEIRQSVGVAVHPVTADIMSAPSVDEAAAKIAADGGRIDILVNTTTLPIFGDFLKLGDEDWMNVLQTKYLGYVRTIRAALPHMLENGDGRIVNVTGKGGKAPRDVHLPGSSVNAAVNLLTLGLAHVYGKQGIRVVAVSPGVIDSPRLEAIRKTSAQFNKFDEKASKSATEGSNALGRLGTAKEVSNAVLFAVSDVAGFSTGNVIDVDGG